MRIIIQQFSHSLGFLNAFKALGHTAYEWDEQFKSAFDMFNEFHPELVICRSDLSHNLLKCIIKYKPQVRCYLSQSINPNLTQYVKDFFTDKQVDFPNCQYMGPLYDSVRYHKVEPFGGITYIGDFDSSLSMILHAVNDTDLRILGAGWPCRSLGRFLDNTEMKALSGVTLSLRGLDVPLKTLGCGGIPLMLHSDEKEALFGPQNLFKTYDEMLQKMQHPRKLKFDIEKYTYIEKVKQLL